MTVKEPQEDELLASASTFVAAPTQRVETPPARRISDAPARARRPDYRLRGLDLEAPALVEAKPRVVRKSHPSRRRRRRRLVMQWLIVVGLLAATAVALRVSVVRPYTVRSTSMVPTLSPGTDVLVLRPKALTGHGKVGELVVFHRPTGFTCSGTADASTDYLKRVIAVGGQTIWSSGYRIYVDGRPLAEAHWYNKSFGELGPAPIARTVVPAGSLFVLGDNRTDPCDSRAFGPIAASSVVGKVIATTSRGGHPSVHFF